MTNSFKEEIELEIKILKKELLSLVSKNQNNDFDGDTEEYSKFIMQASKLKGKIEALEYSLKTFNNYY